MQKLCILTRYLSRVKPTYTRNFLNRTDKSAPISENQVRGIIISLKRKCSPGLDNINAKNLQLVIDIITPILLDIFNRCIVTAEFPDCIKETVIIPIHKNGDKALGNLYRPISNIPTIEKAFEKLINIPEFLILIRIWRMMNYSIFIRSFLHFSNTIEHIKPSSVTKISTKFTSDYPSIESNITSNEYIQ